MTNMPHETTTDFGRLVVECQQSYLRWQTCSDPAQYETLRQIHRAETEQLWHELANDLRRIARRWRRSGMGSDIESLAMSMFVHVIEVLPHIVIDPSRNVRGLLLMIARRDTIDEYRKSYSNGPHSRSQAAQAAAPDTQMWNGRATPIPVSSRLTLDQPDPKSIDNDTQIAIQVDNQHLLHEIWEFWSQDSIPAIDQRIVQLRWLHDPPQSFATIARILGDGWEEAAVRQRHHRILKNTRLFLRERGLLEDNVP